MKRHQFIKSNWDVVNKLMKSGYVSISTKFHHDIYNYYKGTDGMKKKMDRYSATAEAMKTSERSVIRAIREMEKSI